MAILASLEEPRVKVSTIELEEPEHPYTFETIERLRNTLGESTRLFFVIGADSFEEISTWREPARLLSSTNVIVVTRPGYSVKSSHLEPGSRSMVVDLRQRHEPFEIEEALNQYHIYVTGYVDNAISSTEIRRRVRDGESIEGMVPPGVADYITKYELYKAVN
jgi:nicotinate-nucleotide adenylyltransferase